MPSNGITFVPARDFGDKTECDYRNGLAVSKGSRCLDMRPPCEEDAGTASASQQTIDDRDGDKVQDIRRW